jgi:HEPN domain-containing protein
MSRGYRENDSRQYDRWMVYAYTDLFSARKLAEDERCQRNAVFHCQQCIEKALKAYLMFKRHRLYDGHNLTWLCKQAMQYDRNFEKWLAKSTAVNKFYIETRYPSDIMSDITTELLNDLIESTSQILEFVTGLIHYDYMSSRRKN